MSVHHSLFCFFFLSLHIPNSRTAGPVTRFYEVPGGKIKVQCSFPSSGEWKIFCWENCEEKNILIETRATSDRNGRYRIESDENNQYGFTVSISALTQSDSGRYRCGWRTSSSRYSFQDFEVVVAEDLLDGNNIHRFYKEAGSSVTVTCYFGFWRGRKQFCRGECEEVLVETDGDRAKIDRYSIETSEGVLYVSISALTQSDSGRYRCGWRTSSSRYSFQDFEVVVAEDLLDGNNIPHLHKEAGSSVTVACYFGFWGGRKQFCRGECEEVLVETDGDRAKIDRYSIETSGRVLYVSISALTQSDSGRYRCNLNVAYGRDPYRDFNLTVTDAVRLTTTKTTTKTTTTSTTRSFSSSASSFTSSGSSAPTKRSALGDGNKSSPDVLLIVGLALVFIIIFIILTVALLVFCRNRSQRHAKDPAVKTKKTAVETTRVYEEVRGDEMKSVPVEICTVYSYASYSKPAAADGVYSLVTAALPLDKAEDDLTGPTYAQVNFPYRRSDKPSDDAVHSVRRVAVGSHVGEESLYSNTA
ncbi:polymeric immunoglobulin receptor-like isoform X1 [Gambusia affinis]|uniref:polymeric immunoglobulin receptor-like isoform X1 n=1 Tax=Gambusia affinis TaxID=33528 RepID=UPI001CDB6E37|nr:polymeric immunoglobulin receptor-like isoform X1 [Gambusia affinis]